MLTFGSLFTGIGGFDLGFENAGLKCLWQVEKNQYCLKVLKKHWPQIQRFKDITTLKNLSYVDIICGGFPCQDISIAGKKKGIKGDKSGLWSEMLRIICKIRPKYIVVENVAALINRGLSTVLRELAESGYDAEWQMLSAKAFGAPHIRERVFIVAYLAPQTKKKNVADSHKNEHSNENKKIIRKKKEIFQINKQKNNISGEFSGTTWWAAEPTMGRVANGIPKGMDRIKCLGNAVIPQIAEYIGFLLKRHNEQSK